MWKSNNTIWDIYAQDHSRVSSFNYPLHGHGRIRPCPCRGTGPNSGLSLYVDRVDYDQSMYMDQPEFILINST